MGVVEEEEEGRWLVLEPKGLGRGGPIERRLAQADYSRELLLIGLTAGRTGGGDTAGAVQD